MNKKKKGKVGKVLLIILASIVAFLLIMTAVNYFCCLAEKNRIDNYGTKVEITGGTMNVGIFGSGKNVVVLLPGSGDVSPVIDFKYLTELMSDDCTVLIPELFGYGFSDITDRERNFENIANEIHECLSKLGYKSYSLMGHSLSGMTMLQYTNLYPDEVKSVIALDTSVPKQIGELSKSQLFETDLLLNLLSFARTTGIVRLYFAFGGTYGIPSSLSDADAETIKYLAMSSLENRNVLEEGKNFTKTEGTRMLNMKYPEKIPVLTFLAEDNIKDTPEWELWHRELSNNKNSRLEILSGDHYVYWNHPEYIAKKSIDFINGNYSD